MSRPKVKTKVDRDQLIEYAHIQLAYWNALRRMGFQSNDIFAAFYNGGEIFTTLKVGDKEWSASVSEGAKVPSDLYLPVYAAECDRYNFETDERREEIFRKYIPVEKMIQMAISLRSKDILIPALPDAPPAEDMAILRAYMEGRLVIVDRLEDGLEGEETEANFVLRRTTAGSQPMPN